jgi:hypothetical protein
MHYGLLVDASYNWSTMSYCCSLCTIYAYYNATLPIDTMFIESEVLSVMVMKSTVLWFITPCSPLKVSRCFRGTYHHTIFWDITPCSLLKVICHLLSHWFLARLFFDNEDGDTFLQNVSWLQQTALCYNTEDNTLDTIFLQKLSHNSEKFI